MKIVHTADLHLGLRQFDKLTQDGFNVRETDIARSTARAFVQIAAEEPDVVVIAGDIFHQSRPTNPAIVHAFMMFERLREALPDAEIIMVAGNHDAPRTSDAGCILQLFRTLDIHVVENSVQEFEFKRLGLYVMAVPDVVGIERPTLAPNTDCQHRVLLMHGEIAGVIPIRTPNQIELIDLHADEWDYIALGHWHVHRQVAPNAWYSGSLDFCSTSVWSELHEPKGFVVQDLSTSEHRFVPVTPARQFLELDPIDCADLIPADIDVALRFAVETAAGGIDDKVVRVVLRNCTRHLLRELNQSAIREYRGRALHFQIDARKPEAAAVAIASGAPGGPRVSLRDVMADYFQSRALPASIDRNEFVALGAKYLSDVDDARASAPVMVEA